MVGPAARPRPGENRTGNPSRSIPAGSHPDEAAGDRARISRCCLPADGGGRAQGQRVAQRLQQALDKDIPLLKPLANQIGWDPENSKLVHQIAHAFALSSSTLQWIALALAGYALIESIEAVGLWLMQRWGEYFAVIATSVFLPLEIYELTEKITALRVFALIVNIVAVVWLLWSKRLFGLNGGGKAYRDEHEAESLLSVESAGLSGSATGATV